jgi:anti-sigma-K factor RskA
MSGSDTLDESGPESLAGEYVLGTLDAAETAAAQARIEAEPAFAAEVQFWELRLMPLTLLAPPLPPPAALWPRIEASVGGSQAARTAPPRAANDNRLILWRTTALAGLAIAASLAAFIVLRQPVTVAERATGVPEFAVLTPTNGAPGPVLVAVADASGGLTLRPAGPVEVAATRDMQLWSLPPGAPRPASLGVLPVTGKQIPPGLQPGTKLLVSLEPKGGSPTGQPTGPVIYGGTLQRID